MPAGTKYSSPAIAVASEPSTTTSRRPRWSASRPASGRRASPVIANAPLTIPTSKSEPPSGPRTYRGSTGRVAPTASSPRPVTTKIAAKARCAGVNRELTLTGG